MEVNQKAIGQPVNLAEKISPELSQLIEAIIARVGMDVANVEQVPPAAFIGQENQSKPGVCMILDFSDEKAKAASARGIRRVAKDLDADFVVLVSESFMLSDLGAADYLANPRQISERLGASGSARIRRSLAGHSDRELSRPGPDWQNGRRRAHARAAGIYRVASKRRDFHKSPADTRPRNDALIWSGPRRCNPRQTAALPLSNSG